MQEEERRRQKLVGWATDLAESQRGKQALMSQSDADNDLVVCHQTTVLC